MPADVPELTVGEGACLALLNEGIEHGWAIGSLLAPDGSLGRIWSLSRPLTYRAIEHLVERGLVARSPGNEGRGRERSLLRLTDLGRSAAAVWLDAPVTHPRDLRTELLLKLTLRQRAGIPIEPLLDAQEAVLGATLDALTKREIGDDLVALWRQENARAARRFLRQARELALGAEVPIAARRSEVRLSARNQLRVTIDTIAHGDVMTSVKAVLPDGQRLTAAITSDAVDELDLAAGDDVVMIVKSTEIMVAKAD